MSKIPPHAQRVFKGIIYDVYHWEQELFDGTTATFECLKRPNTVVVIPIKDGQVFYSEQEQPGKPPFISLFGGRAEEGEDPLTTAQRELSEETGFTSNHWHLLKKFETPGKTEWHIYYFIAYNCQKTTNPHLDAGEKIEVKSVGISDFLRQIVANPRFAEHELRNLILSAPNQQEIEKLRTTLDAIT